MKLYIGDSIKRLRFKKNVTQEALADYLSVSRQAISRWENNTVYPDTELLPEIAQFFDVSLEELLGCKTKEATAENRARILVNEAYALFSLPEEQFMKQREKLLSELRELEHRFPHNWCIKDRICEALFSTKRENEPFDMILPDLRRYADEALRIEAREQGRIAEGIIRYMVFAAPEEEVEDWASLLPEYDMNLQPNVMKIRYQERKEWEKARYWESRQKLLALRDLVICGPIPETEESVKGNLHAVEMAERVYDAAIGTPYMDNNGRVHNSIRLYERIGGLFTKIIIHIQAEELAEALEILKKAADYSLLYADAVMEGGFTSDNPYFEPQEAENPPFKDIGQERALREHSLDFVMKYMSGPCLGKLREDERFREQLNRIAAKKAEITKYWQSKQ